MEAFFERMLDKYGQEEPVFSESSDELLEEESKKRPKEMPQIVIERTPSQSTSVRSSERKLDPADLANTHFEDLSRSKFIKDRLTYLLM